MYNSGVPPRCLRQRSNRRPNKRSHAPRTTPHSDQETAASAESYTVAPVAYQTILEPGIGQFREFECPRVHTRFNSFVRPLSRAQIVLRKARERELATLDIKSTGSGIAEPYARLKSNARTGGEKGRKL